MKYISTRGRAPALPFEDALLTGLARDGGLYVPESWLPFDAATIGDCASLPYAEAAMRVMAPFLDGLDLDRAARLMREAYAGFRHEAVVPLRQLGPDLWLLELFHGPTLAFKDVAMQVLARLFDDALLRRGRRVTILGATSGDTGAAAIGAFQGRAAVDLYMLYPHGRISEVQRRQMTTVDAPNVHAIAVDGDFDACQALVKAAFNDLGFRDEMALSAVNSINWARVLPQVVYYVTAAAALGAPAREVAFSVPTGNFGDVYAGYVAQRCGLPVGRLIVATNANDILDRFMRCGTYERHEVVSTQSPSMDIQVASNFERLLFDLLGRDGAAVQTRMDQLAQSGRFAVSAAQLAEASKLFGSAAVDEAETTETIARTWRDSGILIDPHTAVALAAGRREAPGGMPTVVLATAHPGKFPNAIEAAIGRRPEPPRLLAELMQRKERVAMLDNDLGALQRLMRGRAHGPERRTA